MSRHELTELISAVLFCFHFRDTGRFENLEERNVAVVRGIGYIPILKHSLRVLPLPNPDSILVCGVLLFLDDGLDHARLKVRLGFFESFRIENISLAKWITVVVLFVDKHNIRAAGTGVAMGNAIPELKAVADLVTDNVGDNGIWNACVRLGLIPGEPLPGTPGIS